MSDDEWRTRRFAVFGMIWKDWLQAGLFSGWLGGCILNDDDSWWLLYLFRSISRFLPILGDFICTTGSYLPRVCFLHPQRFFSLILCLSHHLYDGHTLILLGFALILPTALWQSLDRLLGLELELQKSQGHSVSPFLNFDVTVFFLGTLHDGNIELYIYIRVCALPLNILISSRPIWWPGFLRRWRCVRFPRRAGSRGRAACEALEAVAMTPKVCNQWLKCFDAKKQFQELMNVIELERNWPFNTMYYETVYINLPNFGLLIQANVVNLGAGQDGFKTLSETA